MVSGTRSHKVQIHVIVRAPPSDVETALRTWASIERNAHQAGWYSSQPWFKPELTGYRTTVVHRTSDDLAMGEKVGGIVNRMASDNAIHADALRYFYGAFPGAQTFSKRQRARLFHRQHGIGERDFYRIRGEAKRMVEGALSYA